MIYLSGEQFCLYVLNVLEISTFFDSVILLLRIFSEDIFKEEVKDLYSKLFIVANTVNL